MTHPLSLALRFAVLGCAALLAACTTLMPSDTRTPVRGRALSPIDDDLSQLVLAFDVPGTVQPVAEQSTLRLDFISPAGERHVVAHLALTDPGVLATTLPKPGKNRMYYFLGVSETDKAALREAQGWAKSLGSAAAFSGSSNLTIMPQLCAMTSVAPTQTEYTVHASLPGSPALNPVVPRESVATLLSRQGATTLPFC